MSLGGLEGLGLKGAKLAGAAAERTLMSRPMTWAMENLVPEGVGAFGGRLRPPRGPRWPIEPPAVVPETEADIARRSVGGNMPPKEFEMSPWEEQVTPAQNARAERMLYPRQGDITNMVDVPSLRGMPIGEALKTAVNNPHLIEGGAGQRGAFVGGPPAVQSMADLQALRDRYDQGVGAGERGARWYDEYRDAIARVTGNNPLQNLWMARLQAQYSPSAQPETELGFALGESNAAVMGDRRKTGRVANFNAFTNALQQNDPYQLARGQKTGEYGTKINPDLLVPSATGVNDFRQGQQLGFKKGTALGPTQHTFMDYETAQAVNRANAEKLGGRDDWTGEQIQAAGWVHDKAQALMRASPNLSYEDAFARAKTTIGDWFDKHTAYMTHEVIPGSETQHLPRLQTATQAEKDAYSLDPRASWAIAPGNRDAIYSSFVRPDRPGVAARVDTTVPYQGVYQPPKQYPDTPQTGPLRAWGEPLPVTPPLELNKGMVARPLISFQKTPQGSVIADADKRMLDLAETLRGSIDVQNAEAGHASTIAAPGKSLGSLLIENPHGPLTRDQAAGIRDVGVRYGYPDLVDRGNAVALTNFGGAQSGAAVGQQLRQGDILHELGQHGLYMMPRRVAIGEGNSVYRDLVPLWRQGEGSGAVTRNLLAELEKEPFAAKQLDVSQLIPQVARNKMALDAERAGSDYVRQDVQNLRDIVGQGPGWQDRLRDALKSGKVSLPSLLLPGISLPYLASRGEDRT
jgi:hypothetical protein